MNWSWGHPSCGGGGGGGAVFWSCKATSATYPDLEHWTIVFVGRAGEGEGEVERGKIVTWLRI